MKLVWLFVLFLTAAGAHAEESFLSWEELEKNFNEVSPHSKILSHVECFFDHYGTKTFKLSPVENPEFYNRCESNSEINMTKKRVFAVVDYTVNSKEQRLFLIDRVTGKISAMAVAHGRYQAGFFNRTLEENKNTVKDIRYYSNTVNSMASSSGYFIGGQDYEADDFGRSLVIHGLEKDINDNACERDVVVHKHFLVTKKKVYMSSSGCLMVSPRLIDHVIDLLRGKKGDDLKLESGGSLIFIYGPREEQWKEGTCPGAFTPVQ